MAFTKLKLTTFGQTIEAKRHQGKGIHFTRVAIGDGLLGNSSMINRTELISERHSMLIDGILTTDDAKQSAVVVTLDNSQFTEGFSYRELAIFAKDPDTEEEGTYLYDNAGAECEYLDTQANGIVIYERIKLLIRVEQTEDISFVSSGNPLYLSAEDVEEMIQQHNSNESAHPQKADLGKDGKILPNQLPEMDYEAPLKDAALKDDLADEDSFPLIDSEAGSITKRVLWSRAKELLGGLFVPLTRKINNKALSADISLTASDVGAAAASHSHPWDAITGRPSTFPPASHSHAAGDINSGILGVVRGGTGKGSFDANRLLYASTADALAQLGFPATAGSVLRQGTSGAPYWTSPDELLAALGLTNAAKIATGSYVGTGTYGASNPCSLTFPFMPELVIITRKSGTMFSKPYGNSHKNLGFAILIRGMESYTGNYSTDTYEVTILWSDHGISWYQESSYSDGDIMLNLSGVEYCFIAIG